MSVDAAFAELLADKRSELRAPPAHVSVDDMRAGNKAYLITAPKTPIHAIDDRVIPGPAGPLNVRIYRPTSEARLPSIVFCHGGGFVLGDLDTHDSICRRLAHSSGCAVVAVDYRRAPETRFPGALDDCTAVLGWLGRDAADFDLDEQRLALCGDSAGGNLAAATALRARRGGPGVSHVALLYPMLDPACDTESMHAYGRGYLLARSGVQWSWSQSLGEPDDAINPLVALLQADLAGLRASRSSPVVTRAWSMALRDCHKSRGWQRKRSTTWRALCAGRPHKRDVHSVSPGPFTKPSTV